MLFIRFNAGLMTIPGSKTFEMTDIIWPDTVNMADIWARKSLNPQQIFVRFQGI